MNKYLIEYAAFWPAAELPFVGGFTQIRDDGELLRIRHCFSTDWSGSVFMRSREPGNKEGRNEVFGAIAYGVACAAAVRRASRVHSSQKGAGHKYQAEVIAMLR